MLCRTVRFHVCDPISRFFDVHKPDFKYSNPYLRRGCEEVHRCFMMFPATCPLHIFARTMGWQRSFTLTLEDMGNRTFSCITWSPNGKTLAVGYTDGTMRLFGVETGACCIRFLSPCLTSSIRGYSQQEQCLSYSWVSFIMDWQQPHMQSFICYS